MAASTIKYTAMPRGFTGANYIDFIESISRKRETRNYLEIGVHYGHMLCRVGCDTAVGVDPSYVLQEDVTRDKRRTFLHRMSSDRFFAETDVRAMLGAGFDLAFLDGLHQFEYLLRDFYNTEAVSEPNGLIILHDCMPLNGAMTVRDPALERSDEFKQMWTGDVWKLIPILREYRPDLTIQLVDCPPTGLVCITGLDPDNRVLKERYGEIVREHHTIPSNEDRITQMYRQNPVMRSTDILNGLDHTLFFPI